MRQDEGAFTDRIHIATKPEVAEVLQERSVEERLPVCARLLCEVGQIARFEAKLGEDGERLLDACGHRESASKGRLSEVESKRGALLQRARAMMRKAHRELVEVSQQRGRFFQPEREWRGHATLLRYEPRSDENCLVYEEHEG